MGKFVFNNKEYEYYPNISERAVEIPIAMEYLQRYAEDDILEVGNVLFFWKSEYFIGKSKRHIVVDKNEVSGFPEVLNIDIMDYKPDRKFGLIICISTLEHIGWDCKIRNSPKCYSALLKMESLLDSGGILFLTFPVRYNNYLDKIYGDGLLPLTNSWYMKRISESNDWKQCAYSDFDDLVFYAYPYSGGNGVVFGEFMNG